MCHELLGRHKSLVYYMHSLQTDVIYRRDATAITSMYIMSATKSNEGDWKIR